MANKSVDLLTVDWLLKTTRSIRKKMDFNKKIDLKIIQECIDLAIHAPNSANAQQWRFVIINDPDIIQSIAEYYKEAHDLYVAREKRIKPEETWKKELNSSVSQSIAYLAENIHRVPVIIIPCIKGRVEDDSQIMQASLYGSILPATWSLMMALRSRGLASTWTTLHILFEKEIGRILNIPEDFTQAALLPVAYPISDVFYPAKRLPVQEVISWNKWNQSGFPE